MAKTIGLVGTFDTKGEELAYVRDRIRERGHAVKTIDAGVLADPAEPVDISADEVARAGGRSLAELREAGDRGLAMETMTRGMATVVPSRHASGSLDGVVGLGGGGGTNLAAAAMRSLPVGVPKVMVSTVASGDVRPYVGVKDVCMMYSVVDIAGINRISRQVLANAAGAVCGMVEQRVPEAEERPLVAASMFGVTTPCVDAVRQRLETAGYEVLVFHMTGTGGQAMESLIADGYVDAVADITTTEWCDEVVGGVLSAGPHRLEAAAAAGLPQVVSVGACDMVNFRAMETVPEQFKPRNLYKHNPNVTLMRTTAEEAAEVGRRIGEKVSAASGPTTVLFPLRGVSMIDQEGQPFHDPDADRALLDALRETVRSPAELVEVDRHINDPGFAADLADRLVASIRAQA